MAKPTENIRRPKKSHHLHVTLSPESVPAGERIDSQDLDYYDPNDDFSPEQDLYVDPMHENMDQRVHLAQERLSRLRKEADDIEREKHALEELRRKQQGFIHGRTDMLERLSRAVALLDRESTDSRRKIEQMLFMREAFAEHMEAVHSLTPEDWSRQNLQQELTTALSVIEDAKMEYDRNMARFQAFTQMPVPSNAPSASGAPVVAAKPLLPMGYSKATFLQWAFCGLAFTAPILILLGMLALIKALF